MSSEGEAGVAVETLYLAYERRHIFRTQAGDTIK